IANGKSSRATIRTMNVVSSEHRIEIPRYRETYSPVSHAKVHTTDELESEVLELLDSLATALSCACNLSSPEVIEKYRFMEQFRWRIKSTIASLKELIRGIQDQFSDVVFGYDLLTDLFTQSERINAKVASASTLRAAKKVSTAARSCGSLSDGASTSNETGSRMHAGRCRYDYRPLVDVDVKYHSLAESSRTYYGNSFCDTKRQPSNMGDADIFTYWPRQSPVSCQRRYVTSSWSKLPSTRI
uniref:Uncharacterized protein n=1 Tax=Parascaris univalens TaxID=6257 RepID=A0A915AFC1_PARUN